MQRIVDPRKSDCLGFWEVLAVKSELGQPVGEECEKLIVNSEAATILATTQGNYKKELLLETQF